jgi:hypothetical protein
MTMAAPPTMVRRRFVVTGFSFCGGPAARCDSFEVLSVTGLSSRVEHKKPQKVATVVFVLVLDDK